MNLAKSFLYGVRLSSINFSNGSVSFLTDAAAREDLSSSNTTTPSLYDYDNSGDPFPAKALKEIRISGGNFCKSFDFGHSYFYDDQLLQGDYGTGISSVGSVYNLHSDKKRLKLDSVQERSCDNTVLKPAHIFEYFEEGETELLRSAGYSMFDGVHYDFPRKHVEAVFHQVLPLDAPFVMRVTVGKLGNTSIRYDFHIFADAECTQLALEGSMTVVVVRDGKPAEIPQKLREALS